MNVSFSFYTKKNGSLLVYANGSNGCSIAIDGQGAPAPYGKYTTQGQRNLIEALTEAFEAAPEIRLPAYDEENFVGRRLETPYGTFVEAVCDNGRDEGQRVVLLKKGDRVKALPYGRHFGNAAKFFA